MASSIDAHFVILKFLICSSNDERVSFCLVVGSEGVSWFAPV